MIAFAYHFLPDRFTRFRPEFWQHGAPHDESTNGGAPPFWLDASSGDLLPQISRLLPFTDFYSLNHVTCFSSISELASKIAALDPIAVHRRMRVGHGARMRASATQLTATLK